jgi:hypothetical protein
MDRMLWTQILDVGPPNRFQNAMAYDSDRDRVVLFSGRVTIMGPQGFPIEQKPPDTWEFDGSTWVQIEDIGPPGRSEAGMCYDSGRKRTVLFGGANDSGLLNDTWEWDGELWTQVAESGPPAGAGNGITYDGQRGNVLHFSFGNKDHPQGTTWTWNGVEWTQVDDLGAHGGFGVMAYDATAQRVLLCTDSLGEPVPQPGPPTFSWTGSSWKQISDIGPHVVSAGANMCFDGKELVLYLPGMVQTWTWHETGWVQRQDMGPSARLGSAMVGDLKRQRCVLFGHEAPLTQVPETWVLRRV